MRRFVALSLSFFILVNCFDIKSSALNIKTTMSSDSDDIVSANYINPTQQYMPYFDASMSSFCIGLLEFKLKNPQKFMPNVKANIKVSPPPSVSWIAWNKFKNAIWPISHTFATSLFALLGAAGGAALGSWKYNVDIVKGSPKLVALSGGGIFLGLGIRFLISDSGCSANDFKMTINRIPFKYSLVPISEQEAKTLQANKVRAGEKKENQKESEKRYEEIQDVNGLTLGEAISNRVLMKGYNILKNPDVDPGDPFGLMRNAKFLKLDEYKYPRNFENYFSDKESKAINTQNAMKKSQFCKNHSDDQEGINVSNYSSKILGTLSRNNPVQYVAIMVNNSVEAAKLRKLLERSYSSTSQLSYRLNISFSTEITSSLPDGSTADEDTERKAEIALGTGPSRPARIVSFFVPHGVAGYASSLIDFIWKPIYSGGAWACDKIKSKFLIEKDPVWVIPQEDNPPWVVPEVEPGVDPPWTIPPEADPWYKRAWNKVKSWFSFEIDPKDINLAGTLPSSLDNLANMPPQVQQNQNNQQQPQNPYNSGPNYYDPSAANGQAQQQGNQPPNQGVQQQQNVQRRDAQTQVRTTVDQAVDATENDRFKGIGRTIKETNNASDRPAANNNSKADTSSADKNDDDWPEAEPVKKIDLNAIPQGKNRDGNFSQHKDSNMFSSEDEE